MSDQGDRNQDDAHWLDISRAPMDIVREGPFKGMVKSPPLPGSRKFRSYPKDPQKQQILNANGYMI